MQCNSTRFTTWITTEFSRFYKQLPCMQACSMQTGPAVPPRNSKILQSVKNDYCGDKSTLCVFFSNFCFAQVSGRHENTRSSDVLMIFQHVKSGLLFFVQFLGFLRSGNPLTNASLMVLIDSSTHALTMTPIPLMMWLAPKMKTAAPALKT